MVIGFFCTIDLSYMNTFFSLQTGPEGVVDRFKTGESEEIRFEAAFGNRPSYTSAAREEIKNWVSENFAKWNSEKPLWFDVAKIPDDILPREHYEMLGSANDKGDDRSGNDNGDDGVGGGNEGRVENV